MPFQGNQFGIEKHNLLAQEILKCFQNDPKMVPHGPPLPSPSPSPASAKVSCQAANKLEKNTCLMIYYDFDEKVKNKFLLPYHTIPDRALPGRALAAKETRRNK